MCVRYGKNRRHFKTLATAVNTCRERRDDRSARSNISFLSPFISAYIFCPAEGRRRATILHTLAARIEHTHTHTLSSKNLRLESTIYFFIARRLRSAGTPNARRTRVLKTRQKTRCALCTVRPVWIQSPGPIRSGPKD